MATAIIYGCSDDLVEIEGDVREEFMAYGPIVLGFPDGTRLSAEYTNDGDGWWRIHALHVGEGTRCERVPCDDLVVEDAAAYSDRVTLTGPDVGMPIVIGADD
jgi:hypothetical protein